MPLPRLGIPSTIMAARANVAASAQKSIVSDCCERLSTAPAKAYPAAPAIIVVATRSAFAFPICPAGTRPGIAACRAGCTMALIEARTKRIGMIIHHRAPVDPAALSTWVNMGVTTRIAARMSSSVTISGLRGNLSATPPRTLLIAIVASAWAMKARATIRASWFVAVYINTSVATRVSGSPSDEIPIAVRRLLNAGFERRTRRLVTFLGTVGRSANSSGLRPWSSRSASTTFGSYHRSALRLMSSTPSKGVIKDCRYRRGPVMVSKESATERMRAPNGITSPMRPAG